MSDTYQVCESCTHRFAVPIGARASKCETCAALDRKDAELTRLHAEAAELRAQLTQSSQAMFDAGATLSAKREEVAALRADLARVTAERDAALAEVGRVRGACSVYRETFRATLVAGFQSGPMACNEEQVKAQADSVLATMDTAPTPPAQQQEKHP